MSEREWFDIVIAAAAFVTAVGLLWRKTVRPFWRAINEIAEALPVLHDIAAEFRPNHGQSLRDTVNEIQKVAYEARALAQEAVNATHATRVAAQSTAIMTEKMMTENAADRTAAAEKTETRDSMDPVD